MNEENTDAANLADTLFRIDLFQARRFKRLAGEARRIAAAGIRRHIKACARLDVNADAGAIREIIDDALHGRAVYAEINNDQLNGAAKG